MKPKISRIFLFGQLAVSAATLTSVHAAPFTWNGTTGNWTDDTKWAGAVVPPNDGTADVSFPASSAVYTATANPALLAAPDTNWSINSLTFNNLNSDGITDGAQNNIIAGAAGATLTLGAGGITHNDNSSPQINSPLIASATQIWNINNWRGNNTGGVYINSDLTLNNNVSVTIQSTGSKGDLYFTSGTTTVSGTAGFTLKSNRIRFTAASQVGRLGTNTLNVDTSTTNARTGMSFEYVGSSTFAGNINFTNGLAGNNSAFDFGYGFSPTAAGTTLTLTGQMTGAIVGGGTGFSGFISAGVGAATGGFNTYDDRYQVLIQGDSSSLTSTANPVNGTGAWHIRNAVIVVDHANALGVGNNLPVLLGNNSTSIANSYAGFLATSGNDVAAKFMIRSVINGSNHRNVVSEMGLSGPGAVTYSGNLYLNNVSLADSNKLPTLKLTAPAGGTATFSGVLSNYNTPATAPAFVPVVVLGAGTVKLSGDNSYRGTTAVREGTLLLGHNNALGVGTSAISLGDTVVVPADGDVVAATTTSLTGTFSWAAGVYTWTSGAPTSLDGVALVDNDRILVKDDQTTERNGVYTRTSLNVWTRATDLDSDTELVTGLRVHVTGGTLNANKNFYMTHGLRSGSVINTPGNIATIGAAFLLNPDAAPNANVALLTDGPITIGRDITVTDNLSAGTSSIGGNSADISTFSGTITLDRNAKLTAASGGTVNFTGSVNGSSAITVTKDGPGTVVFPGGYLFGALNVADGILQSDDYVEASSVTVASGGTIKGIGTIGSSLTAAGTIAPGNGIGTFTAGDVTLTGTLAVEIDGTNFDQLVAITGTSPTTGKLDISGATLTVTELGGGFTPSGSYVIAKGDSRVGTFASVTPGYAVSYTATEVILTKLAGTDYDTWKSSFGPGFTDTATTSDPDGDGMTNQQEYAFGLNPTLGSSANPITVQLDKTTGTFTYTRRKLSLVTPIAYTIKTTNNLATWATDAGATQNVTSTTGDIETVQVTVSPALLSNSKLFVRVSAE